MKSVKSYRKICQTSQIKNDREIGVKLLFRLVSIYFTILLIFLKFKPNSVTILSIIFGILSAIFYYLGYLNFGSLFLFISITLDFSDGEVARYNNSGSLEGEYLDLILHWVLHPIILSSITLYAFNNDTSNKYILILGFLSVIGSILISLVRTYAKYVVLWLNINKINIKSGSTSLSKFSNNSLSNFVSKILEMYDFPYIMLFVILSSLIENYSSFNSIFFVISFLGFTFPIVIILITYTNLKNKRITNFNK
tara:strand:+ start:126 stop:881 length:756 start_codon:yes stop_codon:yes gene_type:complete